MQKIFYTGVYIEEIWDKKGQIQIKQVDSIFAIRLTTIIMTVLLPQ